MRVNSRVLRSHILNFMLLQVSQFMGPERPHQHTNGASAGHAVQEQPAQAVNGKAGPEQPHVHQNGTSAGFTALDTESVKGYLAARPALAACLGDAKDSASWRVSARTLDS